MSAVRRLVLPAVGRHLVREFLTAFLLTLSAFVAIYLIAEFFDRLDSFLRHDAEVGAIVRYFVFKIPLVVAMVTPAAVLVGGLVGLGLLARQNEFVALRACGVSIWQIGAPLIGVAALIGLATFFWSETVVPYSAQRWHTIQNQEIRKRGPAKVFTGRDVWFHGRAGFYNIDRVSLRRKALYGALLGLVPLARAGLLADSIVIDAKSGTTGAGRGAKVEQLFAEVHENFRAYGIASHRHGPEIEQELRAAGATAAALFVPHLLPVRRGILSTMYVRVPRGRPPLEELFARAYEGEPFVIRRSEGPPPELREVRGTNRCVIGWRWDAATSQAIVVTAIDNLGKGASGQAVQCLNVVLGLPETTALDAPALVP